MTQSPPVRPRRRWIAAASVLGGLAVLGGIGELVLRDVIDDRVEDVVADMPPGVTVTKDSTPALWQVATGQATLRVQVSTEALTATARSVTGMRELQVVTESGNLVAQVPLPIAGREQTVDVLLSVAAEDGKAVLRADTVRFAGLSLPVTMLTSRLGSTQLDRLADGVAFPEGDSRVAISSAQATEDGLELGAEMAMRGPH